MSKRAGFIWFLIASITSLHFGVLRYSSSRETGSSVFESLLLGGLAVVITWGVVSVIAMALSAFLYGSSSVTDDSKPTEEEANLMRRNARGMLAERRKTRKNKAE